MKPREMSDLIQQVADGLKPITLITSNKMVIVRYLILLLLCSCTSDFIYKQKVELTYCHRDQKDEIVIYTDGLLSNDLIQVKRHKRGKRPRYDYDVMSTVEFYEYQRKDYVRYLDICNIEIIHYQRIKNPFNGM